MIKSDFRYIIKRILIGVGICFCLSFINSCDVKAYDSSYWKGVSCSLSSTNRRHSVGDSYTYRYTDNYIYNVEYKNDGIYINNYKYFVDNDYLNYQIVIGNYENTNLYIYILKTQQATTNFSNGGGGIYPTFNEFPTYNYYLQAYVYGKRYEFNNGSLISMSNYGSSSNPIFGPAAYDSIHGIYVYNTTIPVAYFSGSTSQGCVISKKDSERSNVPVSTSTINSLGVVKNKNQEENVIVSYTFHPTFNNFDITQYNYQYKIGNNNWLNITTNNSTFNVNQNTTVYFRIIRKSDNEIVDSQTFTITNILKYNDSVNENYNVKYTSENRNINDDESLPNKLVDNVSISFEYFPKQSNLKYQYQYVEENNSLGTWVDMPNNDYERTYSVTVNGIMYNRILDLNDNVLYTSTFKVNSIGTAMINSNLNWYNKLFGKVNYGKGISSIFFLPVRILEVYKTGLESGFCNEYSFGELWGHELKMPCINVRGLVGNNIYNFIDIIGSGVIFLAIINFIINIYNGIVFMNLQDIKNEDKESRLL